jgi:GTP cyclohydrolase IB
VQMWLEETGPVATPHAQRSRADVVVEFNGAGAGMDPAGLIDLLEQTLGTSVQTTVKRVDEQEFARRNAQHLMFCEDAARRLKRALDQDARISDFTIRVEHQESLHAHDAVAVARKDKR